MIFLRFLSLLSAVFFIEISHAETLGSPQKALDKIKGATLVTLEVTKKVKSDLLGTESKTSGKIYLSNNRFRWDTEGQEVSSIIYDGVTVWTVQQPPKGFKMPPQITKMKLTPKSQNQIFLKALFSNKIEGQFTVQKKTEEKKSLRYYLKPTEKNQSTNDVEMLIGPNDSLVEIAYKDEIENKIIVEISKVKKSSRIPEDLFKYFPPKGAQVNEL